MDMWDAYASSRKPLEGEPEEKMKQGTSLGEPIHQAAGLERPDREDFSHKALRHDQDIRRHAGQHLLREKEWPGFRNWFQTHYQELRP